MAEPVKTPVEPPKVVPPEVQTVSKEDHARAVNDMLKYKADLKKKGEEFEALEQKIQTQEETRLAEQEDYKPLYENFKTKFEGSEKKFETFLSAWKDDQKMSAIEKEAITQGLPSENLEDLRLLNTDDVIFEMTDQGRHNVIGAKEFIEGLKSKRPRWFNDSAPPNVNNSIPGSTFSTQNLSGADVLKLQKDNPAEYTKYMEKLIRENN